MRHLNSIAILTLVSAVGAACLPTSASAADQLRSFYQNAAASCHGSTSSDESILRRTEQRMMNTSTSDEATVVCSLVTDALAESSTDLGTVDYVGVWAKRSAPPAATLRGKSGEAQTDVVQMNCILVTSFADDDLTESFPESITLPAAVGPHASQAIVQWIPSAYGKTKLLGPVNVSCVLPPQTELNDWMVVYTVNVGL